MMKGKHVWWLLLMLFLHGATALCYQHAFPLFNWPDEPAQFNYVKRLAEGKGLDVMTEDVWAPALIEKLRHTHFRSVKGAEDPIMAPFRSEAHQPPLYYLLGGAVYGLTRSVFLLKALNLLISCLSIVLVYWIARRLFPENPLVSMGAVLLLALQPMRVFMAVSINNDPAAECVFSAAVLLILQRRKAWVIGLIAGLGILTKIHLILILPLYLLWLFMDTGRSVSFAERIRRGRIWRDFGVAVLVALAVSMPWLWRNISLYGIGDPLALKAGALGSEAAEIAAFGHTRPVLTLTGNFGIIPFIRILFQSWWGVFGWMEWFMNGKIVGILLLLSLLICYGLIQVTVKRCRAIPSLGPRAWAVIWLACSWMAFLVALMWYSTRDFQAQGRYLLVASSASGILFGLGLFGALRRWTRVGLLVTAGILLSINLYVTLYWIPRYLP